MKRFLLGGIITLLVILSFFLYSFRYNPSFNSDGAIQVLMTYYLDFPRDLYYWGQDRWGSLIPLLSQFFFKVLHFSPVNAVSLTYYFLLVGGYLGFASLLKSQFSKIIFAVILFLPPLRFVDVLWYPLGIQYSLLGISLLFLKRIDFSNQKVKNYFLLFVVSVIFIFAQWVSDVALISIFLLVAIHALLYWKRSNIKLTILVYVIFTVAIGYLLISYGKENAIDHSENYLGINRFHRVVQALYKIGEAFKGLLLFQGSESWMSVYTYLSIFFIAALIFFTIKRKINWERSTNAWICFFLLDGLAAICIALASKWVYLSDMNRRYFFGSYITLSLALLLILEQLKLYESERRWFKIALSSIVIIGAISTPYYFKYVWLKSLKPQVEIFSDLTKLAPAGIIGEYWHSYITACPDPSKIVAIPKEDDSVRNPELVDLVFSQPNIYFIRNDWMDSFPDSLQQFGRVLLKDGEEFIMSGCYMCKYKKS